MENGKPLIRLEGIKKVFLTDEVETHALSGIDLDVAKGEFFLVAGPSGCGKSTLLSILGLLERATEGSYQFDGVRIDQLSSNQLSEMRNREIGFIFQSFNLVGALTVLENVELPLRYRGIKPSERKRLAMEALSRVKIEHRANHLPSQLSGGQQQRVAVARAVAGRPSILLADEPTGNLDSRSGAAVMELLARLNEEGTTVCMVTHDPRYVQYAARAVYLFDGRVVEDSVIVA